MIKELIVKIRIENGQLTTGTIERGFTNDAADRLIILGALENLKSLESDKLKRGIKSSEATFKNGNEV